MCKMFSFARDNPFLSSVFVTLLPESILNV